MSDDELAERTDIPMQSPYKDVPMNGSIPLYTGSILLQWPKGISRSKGTITLNLQGKPEILFEVTLPKPFAFVEAEGNLQLDSPLSFSSAPYLRREQTASISVNETKVTGIIYGQGLVIQEKKADGKPESVGRIQFHLINFLEYRGGVLEEATRQGYNSWLGRVSFLMGQWEVILDQFQNIEERLKAARTVNGNVLTHIGLLRRKDNKLFNPDDTREVFDALYWFLSFMNGSRCTFALPTGLRHLGRPLWQHWGLYSTTPADSHQCWFNENATEECFQAADMFFTIWRNDNKREWLNLAMGLYLASNQNFGGIELALANSQILIEMLTWVALQEENTLMSEDSFNKLPAADKIRALLFWLGVSASIPNSLKELKSAFPQVDAPEATVKIRNVVIHPTKTNRSQRSLFSNNVIYEAWQLNLWYADLTLFKLMGYSGRYNNRTGNPHPGIWDITPWASNKD